MVAKGWKSNLTTSSAQGLGHDWMSLGEGPVTIYALPDDAILARYCFVRVWAMLFISRTMSQNVPFSSFI